MRKMEQSKNEPHCEACGSYGPEGTGLVLLEYRGHKICSFCLQAWIKYPEWCWEDFITDEDGRKKRIWQQKMRGPQVDKGVRLTPE